MKEKVNLIIMFVTLLIVVPFTVVNAESKVDKVVQMMNNNETLKSVNGVVSYEDGLFNIEFTAPSNSRSDRVSFMYNGTIIEYSPEEITNYDEASDAIAHYMYALNIIQAAVQANGYTKEQFTSFMQNENNSFDYELNGIEYKIIGEDKSYTSEENGTITTPLISFKVDVKRANLGKVGDKEFVPKNTTIKDVVDILKKQEAFQKQYDEEGLLFSEHKIESDDESITISYTVYEYTHGLVSYPCENDIITYKVGEVEDYESAEEVLSHYLWIDVLLNTALESNGYTKEQISAFFESNVLDYETNGYEFTKVGESKTYTSEDGTSTLTLTLMDFKIDLSRVNLNKKVVNYEVLDGANQKINIAKDGKLSFRFSIDYDLFVKTGKIMIDNKEVSKDSYVSSEGSTIITFNDEYTKKLSEGEHTITALVDNGSVETKFTVENKTDSPKTGDSVLNYISVLGLSVVGFIGAIILKRR